MIDSFSTIAGLGYLLAHDSIYTERAICYRLTVCPSVRPSVCLSHRWINQKWLKLGSCNFHPRVASPSSFCSIRLIQKFLRVPLSGGVKQGWGGENKLY